MLQLADRSKTAARRWMVTALSVLVVSATPFVAAALEPDVPRSFTVLPGAEAPVVASMSWTGVEGAESYIVSVATDAAGPYRDILDVPEPVAEWSDGLSGVRYWFRVVAVDGSGTRSGYAQAGPVAATWAAGPHRSADVQANTCARCHSIHSGLSALLFKVASAAEIPDASVVCIDCHAGSNAQAPDVMGPGGDTFSGVSGHTFDPSHKGSSLTCASCHDAHGDATGSPMIRSRIIAASQDTTSGTQAWCSTCHLQRGDSFAGQYPAVSDPSRDASGYPVAGTWPGMDTYLSSGNAHARIGESTQTAGSGRMVTRETGDCAYCHSAHGSANAYDGLRETYGPVTESTLATDQANGRYATLCLRCHSADSDPAVAGADIATFVTASAAETSTAGHRIRTAGGTLPVGSPLPCYDCHGPHGSTRGNASNLSDALGGGLTTSSPADVRRFCFTCHTTAGTRLGWDSELGEYVPVDESELFEGIARTGGVLALPSVPEHEASASDSCYDCHGQDYASPDGSNVHRPAVPDAAESAALAVPMAVSVEASHAVAASDAGCSVQGCHTGDLALIHQSAVATYSVEPTAATTTVASEVAGVLVASASESTGSVSGAQTLTVTLASCEVCHATSAAPQASCGACHASGPGDHARFASHEATGAAALGETTVTVAGVAYSPLACSACHELDLAREHAVGGCMTCHPSPADSLDPAWDGGCVGGGCHASSPDGSLHSTIDADHAVAMDNGCTTDACHTTIRGLDSAAIHASASTVTSRGVSVSSCLVCHSPGVIPPSGCGSAGCHADRLEPHGASTP